MGGLYPKDLLLVGAGTGVGKTTLAVNIAQAAAEAGKQTYMLALEHYEGEIYDRIVFPALARIVRNKALDFSAWVRGDESFYRQDQLAEAQKQVDERLGDRLVTRYKDERFSVGDLDNFLNEIRYEAEAVIIDNTQRIDRAGGLEVQREIADCLEYYRKLGMRLVVVSQLRKLGNGERPKIVPSSNDFFGASTLKDTATGTIVLSRYHEHQAPHLASTLVCVEKDRKGRGDPMRIAKLRFNRATTRYMPDYKLGEIQWGKGFPAWVETDENKPQWAS